MSRKNGKVMSNEDHKMLAELTLQNDERIEQLWDMMLEIRNAAADVGWKLKDAQGAKEAARIRAQHAGSADIQRDKLRKYLGLK